MYPHFTRLSHLVDAVWRRAWDPSVIFAVKFTAQTQNTHFPTGFRHKDYTVRIASARRLQFYDLIMRLLLGYNRTAIIVYDRIIPVSPSFPFFRPKEWEVASQRWRGGVNNPKREGGPGCLSRSGTKNKARGKAPRRP